MAPGDVIPGDRIIYRAVPWKHLDRKSKQVKETNFLLKPAYTDSHGQHWEDETYLSFGVSEQGATAGLTGIENLCEIRVADILALGHNLQVTEDTDPEKVRVSGMPLSSTNEELAFTIAKDLRNKAKMCVSGQQQTPPTTTPPVTP